MNPTALNDIDLAAFNRDGYLVKKALAEPSHCAKMRGAALDQLAEQWAPCEFEVDVQYPGSPKSADSKGGGTVRRLLNAYTRDQSFRDWGASKVVKETLQHLFQDENICLSQCHHNCVMTKRPEYSSATLWHQDNRYWSFDEENLISAWIALGPETAKNGCLRVIPGSHRSQLDPGRYDASLFLRPDLAENKELMAQSIVVPLEQGDVLFFHSRLFHAAGRNLSETTKLSLVFTYHTESNRPISETRSARYPSIQLT